VCLASIYPPELQTFFVSLLKVSEDLPTALVLKFLVGLKDESIPLEVATGVYNLLAVSNKPQSSNSLFKLYLPVAPSHLYFILSPHRSLTPVSLAHRTPTSSLKQ
jgi:hypothetical protein